MWQSFKNVMAVGLEPDSQNFVNMNGVSVLQGLRNTKLGFRVVPTVEQLISFTGQIPAVSFNHPFPQVFRGRKQTIVADELYIYEVDESDWTVTKLVTYDFYSQASTKGITTGGVWQFIDFGNSWILLNGSCIVVKNNWYHATKVFVIDTMTVTTGCRHNGIIALGGFNESDFWTADWDVENAARLAKGTAWGYSVGGATKNAVWWSGVGGGDFLHLLDLDIAVEGNTNIVGAHDADNPLYLDMQKRNASANMIMDTSSQVLSMVPLGQNLIVGCADAIYILPHVSEPFSTYGKHMLVPIGVHDRGSIATNGVICIALDQFGSLWSIGGKGDISRLGYEQYFADVLDEQVTITYDSMYSEFYISTATKAFILGNSGLSEIGFSAPTLHRMAKKLVGLVTQHSPALTPKVVFGPLDFGSRQTKTVRQLECIGALPNAITATVRFRNSSTSSWTSKTVSFDVRGRAVVECTGVEFEFELSSSTTLNLDDFKVFVEETGKEGIKEQLNG